MAQFADGYSSEQDAYRAWQQEQAQRAAQAEAAARARAQEQAREAVRAAAAARERAAAQARAAEESRARAAAQAEAAARARVQEQAQAATRQQAAQRERAAVQARAAEEARARAVAQAAQTEAAARARAEEQAQASARAEASARERAAGEARAAEPGPPPRGTPEYDAYLREMLNARTQGVASGTGSISEPGEPARRTGRKEPTLAELLRDGFVPGSGATTGPRARVGEAAASGPPPRGTAAYDAYLTEMLNATTQGIASGVGSISEPGEPARRTGPKEPTLAELLRDGFTPGSGAATGPRARVEEAAAPGPPPRGTAAYDAYLTEMLNATTQGIASGVGSISEPGEPARRTGPKEPTLAELLRDGFTPGSGARSVPGSPREPRAPSIADLSERERRLLRNMERQPVRGPGARMFEVTPDEESFWAAISPDEFVSEEALAILGQDPRIPLTDEQIAIVEGLSPEADRRGQAIDRAEAAGRWDEAAALRAGAPLPERESGPGMPRWIGDTAEWIADAGEAAFTAITEGQAAIDEAQYLIPSEVTSNAIASGLETMGEEGADALRRFESELAEWPELAPKEMIGRVHQAALGGVVSFNPLNPLQPFDWIAAAEGLAGNREYRGADHWLLRPLPDQYREPLGELLEDATHPGVLVTVAGGIAIAPVTLAAVAGVVLLAGVGILINDLDSDDPKSVALIDAFVDDVQRLLDEVDPDGEIWRQMNPSAFDTGSAGGALGGGSGGSW